MAEDRTFVLIGEFRDGITPALGKINDSIDSLKRNLGTFGARRGGFNDLTKSMGKVIGAHVRLNEQVVSLRNEMRDSLPVFREYRREAGKVVSANLHMAGGKRIAKKNNPYLQFLDEATSKTRELARTSGTVQLGRRIPRAGGGGGGGGGGGPRPPRPPRPPRMPAGESYYDGGDRGKNRWGVSRDATFAFGQTLGYTLGSTITGSIVQGFQIGVGLMVKPFQMFAGALQERVRDELSDISAAGGLLSVAKRQKENPLVRSFQDSMDLTQHTNKYMAEIAAALPGNTQQYIEVGKRMSDTAARMIAADPAKAIAYAQELAAKEGAGRVVETQQQAYTQIIGNMATQGVLAGLGEGGAGSRGVMGAYGLPQLMERMYNQEEVTMGQFQRYAAIFRDPKIMDALERFIPKINATMKGTVDRARVFDKFFEEVLPPEMVRAFERSTSGIMEAFRTAFIGPETGLLGLGRKMEGMGKKMDAYGRYLDENNEVVAFKDAVDVSLSIFDMLRDIFANISIALYPLIDLLPQIFDPLKNIGKLLVDARHLSGEFLQTFENYVAGLEPFAKQNKDIAKTKKARAGLLAIANFLTQFGAFSEKDFMAIRSDVLNKPSAELGNVLNKILTTFFESDAAGSLGNMIGSIVGTVLKQVATIIEYFLGVAETSKLAAGLKKGFYDAGGPEAFRSIIQNIFKALFKAVISIFNVAPAEFTAIAAATMLIPAFVSSFSVLLANKLEDLLDFAGDKWGSQLAKMRSVEDFENIYKFDKAKPKITGDVTPFRRKGTVASPSGVLDRVAIKNKQFPNVALGAYDAMAIGGPKAAPRIPKPYSGYSRKGAKGILDIIGGDASAKNLGKYFREAGEDMAKGFTKFLGKAKRSVKMIPGALGAGGIAGLRNPIGMLGKFGGALTVLMGVLEGVIKFFKTGDIFQGLGAAAGPIIGTIIGTALLGPLGGLIGSWVGQQESVVNGMANIFEHLAGAFRTLTGFLVTVGQDLAWIASKISGVGEDFDWLAGLMRALEMPFYYMRLGMLGIYELYLKATGRSKSPEAEALRAEKTKLMRQQELKTQLSTLYEGLSPEMQLRGLTTGLEKSKADLVTAKAEGAKQGVARAQAEIEVYEQQINLLKGGKPVAPPDKTTAPKTPPSPIFTPQAATSPAQAQVQAQAIATATAKTATAIADLNKKAAEQVKKTTEVTKAVENLTKKTTGQTSLQTTVTAIYQLLNSGSLRVQGGVTAPTTPGLPNTTPPPRTNLGKNLGGRFVDYRLGDPNLGNFPTTTYPSAGETIVDASFTINQQPGQDAEELASLVAMKLGEAVADARSASLFV